MIENILDKGIDRGVSTKNSFHLAELLLALLNDIWISIISHEIIFVVNHMQSVFVEF